MTTKSFTIRRGEPDDANLLAALGARAFAETFSAQNTPENLDAYLEEAFNPEVIFHELNTPGNTFFISFLEDKPVGFIKLRVGKQPGAFVGPKPIELERIYVLASYAGHGIGSLLKDKVLSDAKDQGYQTMWLGVWKENKNAIRVYTHWGFEIVGEQTFNLGEDIQFDWIMARQVDLGSP